MTTYATIAERTNTVVPAHLKASATIPIKHATDAAPGARQGDVLVAPAHFFNTLPATGRAKPLTGKGHKVVEGDADRNSHILNGDGTFMPGTVTNRQHATIVDYGLLAVPDGGTAYLTHTEEHGSIGFGPGEWIVYGQLEYGAELRRAAD